MCLLEKMLYNFRKYLTYIDLAGHRIAMEPGSKVVTFVGLAPAASEAFVADVAPCTAGHLAVGRGHVEVALMENH